MDTATLVGSEIDIEGGKRLLEWLREEGVPMVAALWYRDPGAEEWRLLIASPRVDEMGKRTLYRVVQKAIGQLGLQRLGLHNVVVLTPRDPLIQALRAMSVQERNGIAHVRSNTISGLYIDDAYVYFAA